MSHRIRTRLPRGQLRLPPHSAAADELSPHLSDAAHYPGGHTPCLYFPSDEAEVAAVLRNATHILAIGAQSSLTGGATPHGEALVSSARLNQIEHLTDHRVRCSAGVTLHALLDDLRIRDADYPPVPTYAGATVGGIAATNAAGAATFKHGCTRDWVEALTVVLANGEVLDIERGAVRANDDGHFAITYSDGHEIEVTRPSVHMPDVPKIACGYFSRPHMDLIDLFIGAEGTLGIITTVTLRIVRPRPSKLLAFVPLADEAAAIALTDELRRAGRVAQHDALDVAAIEYLDARSLQILAQDHAAERLGLKLPEDAGAALLVQVELTGDRQRADAACAGALDHLSAIVDRHAALDAVLVAAPGDERRQAALIALREAVPDGVNRRIRELQRVHGPAISKAAADVIVPFAALADALAAYREIAAAHGLDVAIWGHISDGNVHPNLMPTDADAAHRAPLALREIGRAAIARGGAPMSEHGVGRNPVKQQLLVDLYGADGVASMRAVKDALDPQYKLAPGVIFPARRPQRLAPPSTSSG